VDFACEQADHVVRIDRLHFHRFSSAPLECSAAVVNWDAGTGIIDVTSNNQMPQFAAMQMLRSSAYAPTSFSSRRRTSAGHSASRSRTTPT
jgi:hypothetical protein